MTNDELFDAMIKRIKTELESKDLKFWSDNTRKEILHLLFDDSDSYGILDALKCYMDVMVECGGIDRVEECPHCHSSILVMFDKVLVNGKDTYGFATRNDVCPKCHREYLFNHNTVPWERLIIGADAVQ